MDRYTDVFIARHLDGSMERLDTLMDEKMEAHMDGYMDLYMDRQRRIHG